MKIRSITLVLLSSLLIMLTATAALGQNPSDGSMSDASAGAEYQVIDGVTTITDFNLNVGGVTIFKISRSLDSQTSVYEFFPSCRVIQGPTFSYTIFGIELGQIGLIVTAIVYLAFALEVISVILSTLARLLWKSEVSLDKNVKKAIRAVLSTLAGLLRKFRASVKTLIRRVLKIQVANAASDVPAGADNAGTRKIYDVFISYSTVNKAITEQICTGLESSGIKCWMAPRDIQAGDAYQEAIMNAIDASSVMVLVFSSASNESPHVIRELNQAVSQRVKIIPFRIENILPSKTMSYLICVAQWMDAYEPPLEEHIGKLASRVKSIRDGEGQEDQ